MSEQWKQDHADACEPAVTHPIVQDAIDEYCANMHIRPGTLPYMGICKVATYAAQVARAQALGFDPELLRLSAEEAEAETLARARAMVAAGKPVLRVDESGTTRLD